MMDDLHTILTELMADAYRRDWDDIPDDLPFSGETQTAITNAAELIALVQQNIGSELMASQIRTAIEDDIGRFSNEDANWILDQSQQQRKRVETLTMLLEDMTDLHAEDCKEDKCVNILAVRKYLKEQERE